ncbi:hypothetical protein [Sabulibacter ruber]|uniref:hypothetical protein n=1 Tax=Sabulibacter ruber TaxID=2811901 RepID=UPI001A9594E3|nr:hypothetical protein [Sabulibacter ruber]
MHLLFKRVLLVCLSFSLWSCEETEEEEVTPKTPEATWQEDGRFLYDTRVQTNSHAVSGKLFVMGLNSLTTLAQDKGKDVTTRSILESVRNPTQYKYPVSDDLLAVAFDQSTVVCYPNYWPSIQSGVGIHLPTIDPKFREFDFPLAAQSECMKISPNKVLAIPYQAIDGMKVLLVRLQIQPSTRGLWDEVSITNTQIVQISSNHVYTQFLSFLEDGFYLGNGEATFHLSENGSLQKLRDNGLRGLFTYKQNIYGLFNDGLHQSTDGKSWNLKADISTLNLLSYTSLNDTLLIGTYNDQMFQIRINPTTLSMLELKNEGMKGHKITSLALFNHKVFVTTLSGVFVKEEKDFLSYKEQLL